MRDENGLDTSRPDRSQAAFWCLWTAVLLAKVLIAARLPLFVDEAFYWQEGQHLAAAYSDLPGLTAWLARLGVAIGGNHAAGVARAVPADRRGACRWLVVRIAQPRVRRAQPAGSPGCFALLLPLAGSLGLLALPERPMAFATLLCLDAGARLLREVSAAAALRTGAGPGDRRAQPLPLHRGDRGRPGRVAAARRRPPRAARPARVAAIALGASAWVPLLAWNLDNADAGLRFQLVDRHPWAFHADGLWFVAVQALLVTPLLFVALAHAGWRGRDERDAARRATSRCSAGWWCWASSRWASSPTPSG